MHRPSLADELDGIRVEIARLQRREAQLQKALLRRIVPDTPPQRPGWPIRRITAPAASLH